MNPPPNLLLVMADQVNPAFLPVYGHPVVRMPHLARLAAEGTVFETAYCACPICAPSRFALLTGRLASAAGVYDHGCEMPASAPAVTHYLRQLGYHTALAGKMHFLGPDQLHGFEERLTTDIYPSDFGWGPDWRAGTPEIPWAPTGISPRTVIEAGPCARSLQLDYDDEVAHRAVQKLYDLARRPRPSPFFLTVSFSQPHSPFVASREHWERYRDDEIDPPRVPPQPLDRMDAHSRRLHHMFRIDEYTVTPGHVRNARRAYYGMLSYIDDQLGRLMATLRETGLLENTLVVFTSDHGEMLGERGLWYKQSLREGSVRVPLVVRPPGAAPAARGRVAQPVSLLDLLPTLVEAGAGGAPADYVEPVAGRSLLPLLSPGGALPDRPVFAEYSAEGTYAPCLMVRKGRYKYIHCETDPALLFDLEEDPDERRDLAGDPAHAAVQADLHRELLRVWDPPAYRARALASQRRQWFIQRVLARTTPDAWVHQPVADARAQYVRGGANTTFVKGQARLPFVPPAQPDRPRN
ncbi:MAG: choline-sulfatase [Verrucomicrobia bacterium]|nr:choline-sulfatase [Verrucomicrobiota bacterium]MBM3865977.1 choline-sulfatase [Verrucomicrobiota bacterium]